MRYLVSSEVNSDEILLDTMNEVNEYIEQELKSANLYETKEPYTTDDFNILEVPNTCRACNEEIGEDSYFCSYECSKIDTE